MKIERKILFLLFLAVVLSIVSAGCLHSPSTVTSKTIDAATCIATGEYTYVGGTCCKDFNHNKKCDSDEPVLTCKDECSFNGLQCQEFKSKTNVYSCVDLNNDSCKEFNLERTCSADESCRSGQCIKNIRCGDGFCEGDETFSSCKQDCEKIKKINCDNIEVNGNCCNNSECGSGLICESNVCKPVPYCGDGQCNSKHGENCSTCDNDCKVESGQLCDNGTIIEGNCLSNNNCNLTVNESCVNNWCTV